MGAGVGEAVGDAVGPSVGLTVNVGDALAVAVGSTLAVADASARYDGEGEASGAPPREKAQRIQAAAQTARRICPRASQLGAA